MAQGYGNYRTLSGLLSNPIQDNGDKVKNRIRTLIATVAKYQEPAFKLATTIIIGGLFGSLIIQAICFSAIN